MAYFFIVYFLVLTVTRYMDNGSHVLYEMLWICNLSMVYVIVGILTCRPLLLSVGVIAVSMDQICWYADMAGYWWKGKFPVGVAKYMSWPETSFVVKVTSYHHLWFLPLCIYALKGYGGIHTYSLWLSLEMIVAITIYCRMCTPNVVMMPPKTMWIVKKEDKKEVRTLNECDHARELNINMCYMFWKDVHVSFLHYFDESNAFVYLAIMPLYAGFIVNAPSFVLLRAFSVCVGL
eukprot:TRINITY_DN2318_c0_g1_i1.p1 TRINITY_DN2318_c0_g1~~TRINITY_DN2318_c0_g1_i1.p1  ORF type:complete len:234 (+),score=41.05 TRINITY_DN2318_c0_g1_i1:29-730(+)